MKTTDRAARIIALSQHLSSPHCLRSAAARQAVMETIDALIMEARAERATRRRQAVLESQVSA